jgi:Flp pilus assembly protein TadD
MRAAPFLIVGFCVLLLGGCESSGRVGDLAQVPGDDPAAAMAAADPASSASAPADPAVTGSLPVGAAAAGAAAPGTGPDAELERGKTEFAAGRYPAAERHFRSATERHPENVEAWLGLAAVCDQQRRFADADRAYDRATELLGPTPEILNNRGYSYLLRGDYARARQTLLEARAKDPHSPYIKNNLDLLESKARKAKSAAH